MDKVRGRRRSIFRLSSVIWTTLLCCMCVLDGGNGETAKNVAVPKGSIENLTAEAVSIDHSLQLRIKWALVNINETSFDVRITPFKEVVYCTSQKPCIEYGLGPNTTDILVPKDTMSILEHRECIIELGCRYDIRLESNNRQHSQNITYQVMDCVNGDCLCAYSDVLPLVVVDYRIDLQQLRLIWNVSRVQEHLLPVGVHIDKLAISLARQTNPSLKWGGTFETLYDLEQPLLAESVNDTTRMEDINYPVGSVNVDHMLTPGNQYSVRMAAIDNFGCRGPEGSATITTLKPPTNNERQQSQDIQTWKITVVFVTMVFVIIVALVLFLRSRHMKKVKDTNELNNWLGVYTHIPGMPPITMKTNLLYVDKDILDARLRGDADHLEVPRSSLTIGREIGKGAFGRVFIARANNLCGLEGPQVVAVKQLKKRPSSDEMDEFISEITTMKSVAPHPNVVSLLGCCTVSTPYLMVMEFVGCGDLLHYLRKVRSIHETRFSTMNVQTSSQQHSSCSSDVFGSTQIISELPAHPLPATHHLGPNGKYLELQYTSSTTSTSASTYAPDSAIFAQNMLRPSVTETQYTTLSKYPTANGSSGIMLEYVVDHKELHNFAAQIARGMAHLHKQQITHRDLAARNILIDENKTLKISDFGLSRNGIYVNTRNKRVPLRWLSLEAMRDNLYSAKSDVWSFGVVLWEIGTLGGFPYPTVSNHELIPFLLSGQRLERPEICSEHLYDLMLTCWHEFADLRPEFSQIVSKLEPDHQKIYVDFNELRVDYVFPPIVELSAQYRNIHPENASTSTISVATVDATNTKHHS